MEANNIFLEYIGDNIIQLVCALVIGVVIGFLLFLILSFISKKMVKHIEDSVMIVSFAIALLCLFMGILFGENNISTNILSFFTSFVFSWLLTKKSSREEFKERQQEIAKTAHRHITHIMQSALVTKNRLEEIKSKGTLDPTDVDGILDDIVIIINGIEHQEKDWEDMLSEQYRNEITEKNPEDDMKQNEKQNLGHPSPKQLDVLKEALPDTP